MVLEEEILRFEQHNFLLENQVAASQPFEKQNEQLEMMFNQLLERIQNLKQQFAKNSRKFFKPPPSSLSKKADQSDSHTRTVKARTTNNT